MECAIYCFEDVMAPLSRSVGRSDSVFVSPSPSLVCVCVSASTVDVAVAVASLATAVSAVDDTGMIGMVPMPY